MITISTIPPAAAQTCSIAMHVCPTCGKPVKFNQSVIAQGALIVYHATCWSRRVVQ